MFRLFTNAPLGSRWALAETSFKYHASCRHTHPAADALLLAMREHRLSPTEVVGVTAHVHQGALDVLGPVTDPQTVHQAKFSMGTVLALAAHYGYAGIQEFAAHVADPAIVAFRSKVSMELDPEVDGAYPARWLGKVSLTTADGRRLQARVDEPKGDPGNTLTRPELQAKALRLAEFSGAASGEEMRAVIAALWRLAETPRVGRLLRP